MADFFPTWKNNKIFTILLALVLLGLVFWEGVAIRSSLKSYYFIGKSPKIERTIEISGKGEVLAIPDVANIHLGYETEGESVEETQRKNTERINQFIQKLKDEFKIKEKDIQTLEYNIYPRYDWKEGERILSGYIVRQILSLKIKDLERIGEILNIAGEIGLNEVGDLEFTVEDLEKLKREARIKALKVAKEKAKDLAQVMEVKLGKIISFSESISIPPLGILKRRISTLEDISFPEIERGGLKISSEVVLTYEIE